MIPKGYNDMHILIYKQWKLGAMYLSAVNTSTRTNNINLIRLIAASAVTFGHSFAMLNGSHYEFLPMMNSATFGFIAVAVFFGLSGFLITQSFCRNSEWKSYLLARCLRIFPGLCFANFITVLLVSQIVRHQGLSMLSHGDNWGYLAVGNLFKLPFYREAFQGLPYVSPNGSIWTLRIEIGLYILVMLLGLLGLFKKRIVFLSLTMAPLLLLIFNLDSGLKSMLPHSLATILSDATIISLPICFAFGGLIYLYKEKFYLSIPLALTALASLLMTENWLVRSLSYTYAAFVFGYNPKVYIKKFNFKYDISYGIYVLSWPIQQSLIYMKVTENPYLLFLASMTLVLPLALFSWVAIENPALKWRSRNSTPKSNS
jgi:peptidoglycan/LPS O-acetylase OafA/YrhL